MGASIALCLCAVGWLAYRRFAAPAPAQGPLAAAAWDVDAAPALHPAADLVRDSLADANEAAAERLWKLAYAMPLAAQTADARAHARVRDNVAAVLEVDRLDPRYFPRRPALMPQLLQAVNDPKAAVAKVSRMIAHDPVLAADVLRMANSPFYRASPTPIETIPRAIVICGVDALRGMLAAAMLQPVFRATRKNFPRLPRMLWERTERAAHAAELYASSRLPTDRFEAQILVLLRAIGPLVVYGALVDVYSRNPHLAPSPEVCIDLTREKGPRMALRIARDWKMSARLLAALEESPEESLTTAVSVGELLGTVSYLESKTVIAPDERTELIASTGLPGDLARCILERLNSVGVEA